MSDRTLGRLAVGIATVSLCLLGTIAIGAVIAGNANRGNGGYGSNSLLGVFIVVVPFTAFPIVGALIASRQPRNPEGWLLLIFGVLWTTLIMASAYAEQGLLNDPGSLPGAVFAGWISQWLWAPALGLLGTQLLLRFPEGVLLPGARWRWVSHLTWVVIGCVTFSVAFGTDPWTDLGNHANPFTTSAMGSIAAVLTWAIIGFPVLFIISLVSLVIRFRRGGTQERQQIKWVTFATAFLVTAFVLGSLIGALAGQGSVAAVAAQDLALFSFTTIPIAIGIAVLKYRLYDIDLVISKALVFGALTVFITVAYVGIVVGMGTLLGNPENPALSIAATAVVALAFGPVRDRVRRFANRLVYGKRATPYEVMAGFSRQVAGTLSVEEVLPGMAEAAATGVGALAARVVVHLPDGAQGVQHWPTGDTREVFDRSLVVRYQGEVVGEIDVGMPRDEALTPAADKLLADLAAQAGLALHNVRLTEELEIRARELAVQTEGLRVSRERLVTARDAQRRGLERDIREGPERQLRVIRHELGSVDASETDLAEERLDALTSHANETLEGLRDLARGIFPPLLADKGILAALQAHIRKVGAPATLEARDGFAEHRYDADGEACVYFCCLQAIQNVMRHAAGASCTVRLEDEGSCVSALIADDGPGFDPATTATGMGMQIMQDRVDALEGELAVASAPGQGTTVRIKVPVREAMQA